MPSVDWHASVRRPLGRPARGRGAVAVATAAASATAMLAVGVVGLGSLTGRTRDAVMLHGFTGLDRSAIDPAIRALALSVNPVPYACFGLGLVGICAVQRRFWRAATVGTVLIGAGGSAQVLKGLLATPRNPSFGNGFRVEEIGWPSGHAAAVTALAMSAVIVAPPAWRGVVALGAGAFAVALGFATLALTWHYPSEVLGGVLLAGAWGASGLAVLARLEAAGPTTSALRPPEWVIGWGTAGACVAAALAYVAAEPVPIPSSDRAAMALCAFAIAMSTLGLLVATVVAAPPDSVRDGRGASGRLRPRGTVDGREHDALRGDLVGALGDRARRRAPASGRAPRRR
jgi:membrane-associated phospholipid phosphatase